MHSIAQLFWTRLIARRHIPGELRSSEDGTNWNSWGRSQTALVIWQVRDPSAKISWESQSAPSIMSGFQTFGTSILRYCYNAIWDGQPSKVQTPIPTSDWNLCHRSPRKPVTNDFSSQTLKCINLSFIPSKCSHQCWRQVWIVTLLKQTTWQKPTVGTRREQTDNSLLICLLPGYWHKVNWPWPVSLTLAVDFIIWWESVCDGNTEQASTCNVLDRIAIPSIRQLPLSARLALQEPRMNLFRHELFQGHLDHQVVQRLDHLLPKQGIRHLYHSYGFCIFHPLWSHTSLVHMRDQRAPFQRRMQRWKVVSNNPICSRRRGACRCFHW